MAHPEAEPTVAACRRTGVRFMGAAFDAAAATRAERDTQARSGGLKQACGRSLVLDTLLVLASLDPDETHHPACDGLMAGGKAGVSARPWRPGSSSSSTPMSALWCRGCNTEPDDDCTERQRGGNRQDVP